MTVTRALQLVLAHRGTFKTKKTRGPPWPYNCSPENKV